MNSLDDILNKIDKITEPTRQFTEALDKIIPPHIQQINKSFAPIVKITNDLNIAYQPFFNEISATIEKFSDAAKKWQTERKEDVAIMAENGWYPNWNTFFYEPQTTYQSIDELMTTHLEEDWEKITKEILDLCPNRSHILCNAFELHKKGNYIAAIPLFFSQADGICCEELKSFLFASNTTQEKIDNLIDSGKVEADMFTDVFLEPYKLKNHHNNGISKSSQSHKDKAPNRNGIIHGSRKHLDYGTKTNSLKAFSLLSFVVYTVKDLIKTN